MWEIRNRIVDEIKILHVKNNQNNSCEMNNSDDQNSKY